MEIGKPETEREIVIAPLEEPVPAAAPAERLTVPCAVVPPVTGDGEIVIPASCPFDGCAKRGRNRTALGTG